MYESMVSRVSQRKRLYTEPKQTNRFPSFKNQDAISMKKSNVSDSLKQFQDQLSSMLTKNQINVKKQKTKRRQLLSKNRSMTIQMNNIHNDLNSLKQKISLYKKQNQIQQKVSRILAQNAKPLQNLKPKLNLPSIHQPQPPLPFAPTMPLNYSPYMHPPYPMPYPYRPPDFSSDSQSQEQKQKSPKPKKITRKDLKDKKKMKKFERQKNKVRLVKLMKKVFRAIAYIVILKNLTTKLMKKRKLVFSKFWPQMFLKSTNGIRKWFSSGCQQFFKQMHLKSEAQMQIQGDQSQIILNQKMKTIKILMNLLIQSLYDLVYSPAFEQISQIVHIFCKHGANIGIGVLTPQQLQLTCISNVHGYLRMDKNMQKSQIISCLFFKIIIYNMLLQPWKYSQQKFNINQHKQAYENFYYFSSVFYQIMMHIQDKLLDTPHHDTISLGNWLEVKGKFHIKCTPSLCHLQSNYEQGQMISGLINENAIKQIFPHSFWREQISNLQAIIQKMHHKLRKVHAKFINQIYNYKDMNQFLD